MPPAEFERSSHRAFLWAYGTWILGVCAFFVPAATWSPVSRFALTRAVVEGRSLSIDAYAAATGDRARAGDHWYTDKAPIPSLMAVPVYGVMHAGNRLRGQEPRFTAFATPNMPARKVLVNRPFQQGLYVCSVATAGLAAAGLALGLFELGRRRASRVAALVGSELVVLGTPILPYSTSFYGHVIAGACLVIVVLLLSRSRAPPRASAILSGGLLTCAVGSEYLVAVPALIVVVGCLVHMPAAARLPAARDLVVGALLPALVLGAYHWACFGAPWRTGYSFITLPHFAAGHAQGFLGVRLPTWEAVWGLTFGVRRGLFYIAPVAAAGLVGLMVSALRDRDPVARIGLVALLLLGWFNASYYMWWGGASAGPRHLVPMMGFLALGITRLWRHPAAKLAILMLAAVSVANALVITAVGLEAPEFDDVLRRYAWPAFLEGKVARLSGASSLGLKLGLRSLSSLLPLALWLVVGQIYVLRLLAVAEKSSVDAKGDDQVE